MNSDQKESRQLKGGCLCGGVSFQITGDIRSVVFCHCSQCLKTHGNVGAYTSAERTSVKMTAEETLSWFISSGTARRGFCNCCGASVFWSQNDADTISIAAGLLELPTGLRSTDHIFTDSKSDYYTIDDDLNAHNLGLPQGHACG